MSKENKNIENNQEENLNKPEGNKNWWRKLLGLNPTYRLHKTNLQTKIRTLEFIFIDGLKLLQLCIVQIITKQNQ